MNKDQVNKTNMYQATNLVLTAPANAPIWSGLPAFVRGQGSLAGSLNILAALAQGQSSALTGIAADKDRLQLSVINRVLIVAGAAGSYAYEAGNQTLGAKFDLGEGTLKNTRDSQLDDLAQGVHDDAAALVTAQPAKLAEYGLIPAWLTDLQSAITAYSALVGTPRAAIAGRGAITKAIEAEITRADSNLANLLDRLIPQFAAEHLAFVTAYESARKIVDLGGSGPSSTPASNPTPASESPK